MECKLEEAMELFGSPWMTLDDVTGLMSQWSRLTTC